MSPAPGAGSTAEIATARARFSHLHPVVRGVRLHVRLLASFAVGLASLALLPQSWGPSTRWLFAWNLAIGLYLVLAAIMFARSDVDSIKRRAAEDDEGAALILILALAVSLASLGAILVELAAAKSHPDSYRLHLGLAFTTIVLSWMFVHMVFALHYAHEHYDECDGGGLNFPGDEAPDYWDFLYFSLVIGMTCQVSDVAVARRSMRRTVTAHGAFSFLFNTAILALTVNIAASVI